METRYPVRFKFLSQGIIAWNLNLKQYHSKVNLEALIWTCKMEAAIVIAIVIKIEGVSLILP